MNTTIMLIMAPVVMDFVIRPNVNLYSTPEIFGAVDRPLFQTRINAIDGFQCFDFVRFHAHALKIGDFLESKNSRL